MMKRLRLVLMLAGMTLVSQRRRTVAIALTYTFCCAFLIVITSITTAISKGMENGLTNTYVGHLQLQADSAREDLDILSATANFEVQELGSLTDLAKARETLLGDPSVQAVVPMGTIPSYIRDPNSLQKRSQAMRAALKAGDLEKAKAKGRELQALARTILDSAVIRKTKFAESSEDDAKARASLGKIIGMDLDAELAKDPEALMGFIDADVVRWGGDTTLVRSPLLGTDMTEFAKGFERFEIVRGSTVPPGERGMLVEANRQEEYARNPVVREFEGLYQAYVGSDGELAETTIAQRAERLIALLDRLLLQIDVTRAAELHQALMKRGLGAGKSLPEALSELLTVSRKDLVTKYEIFRDLVMPGIKLYTIDVGDTVLIRAVGRDGRASMASVKIHGVFRFKGSATAKFWSFNLLDMTTFRRLYGEATADVVDEMEEMRAQRNTEAPPIDASEAALFSRDIVDAKAVESTTSITEITKVLDEATKQAGAWRRSAAQAGPSAADALFSGVIPHAAVVLKKGADIGAARDRLQAVVRDKGYSMQVLDWKKVAARFGTQLDFLMAQLGIIIAAVYAVTLVIFNIGVVIAVAGREREFGTLRAMGCSPGLIQQMLAAESLILSGLSGLLGAVAGVGIVTYLSRVGVPASSFAMEVLYGGPRAYPSTSGLIVAIAVVVTVAGGLIASFLPARRAASVEPSAAMRLGG